MESETFYSKIPGQQGEYPLAPQVDSGLQKHSHPGYEIDIIKVFRWLLKWKWVIISITTIATLYGAYKAFSLPNLYKSSALVVPARRVSASGGGGVQQAMKSFGNIASMLGIPSGSGGGGEGNTEFELSKAVLRSSPFGEYLVAEYNITPLLAPEINKEDPSKVNAEAVKGLLLGGISITKDEEIASGLVVSFTCQSPQNSTRILEIILNGINSYTRDYSVLKAKKELARVNTLLDGNSQLSVRNALFSIVFDKTREIVLAEMQDEYVFRIIHPPDVPNRKSAPKRGLLLVTHAAWGVVLSLLVIIALEIKLNWKRLKG